MADTVQIVASPNFVVVINHEMDGNAAGFNVNVNNTGFSVVAGILQSSESIGGIEYTQNEKDKLAAIEAQATIDQSGSEIKVLYEGEPNAFTDALFTKLDGMNANATDDQTGAEIKALYEQRSMAFTDTQWAKLYGIDIGATDDQTNSEIKTAYELNANTNAFEDAEKSKLAGIEDNATADQTDAQIRQAVENASDSHVFTDGDHSKLDGIEAADNDWTGANNFGNTFAISGELQPPILTASVNNYEPTGIEDITVLRLLSDATWTITGIAGGFSGRILTLTNSGQNFIILADDSANSLVINRFSFANGDRTLFIGESVMLRYDGTENLWHNINDATPVDMTDETIRTAVEAATDSNVFTDADHSKLNAIEAGATTDQTDAEIRAAVAAATDSNVFDDADASKLDAIEAGAKDDQTGAEIKTLYEQEANAFTDAKDTKLTGIETDATADQSDSEIATAYGNVVAKISGQEIIDGNEATVRRFSPDDMEAMIAVHTATPFNTQSDTDYTLTIADADGIVEMKSSAANELTIPLHADVPYAIGTVISISMMGVGVTSVSAAYGVTLNGIPDGQIVMVAQFDAVSMYKRATDEWVIQGGGSLLSDWWATLTVDGNDPGLAAQFSKIEGGRYMSSGASKTLGEILDFTRASDGTFYDAVGVQQTGVDDVERMDHDPATGEILGLAQEDTATNLVTRSIEFDHVNWIKTNTTVSASFGVAPNGATETSKLVEDAGTNEEHLIHKTMSVISGKIYAVSIFARAAGRNKIFIRRGGADNMPAPSTHHFDLVTGVTSGSNWDGVFIKDIGDDIFRCTAVFTATGTGLAAPSFGLLDDADPTSTTYDGDGSSGVELWGAHIEEVRGVFEPSSFIKTIDATATRVRDTIFFTAEGGLPHPSYSVTENTIVIEFTVNKTWPSNQQIFSYGTDINNRIDIFFATGAMAMFVKYLGNTEINSGFGTLTIGQRHKIAVQWNSTTVRVSFDGANTIAYNSINTPTVNQLLFGRKIDSGNNILGVEWHSFIQYPSYFSQAALEALSAP